MSWHVTRRDLLLVLTILVLFGLFLQLDLSFRFTDSKGSDSLLGLKLNIGGSRPGPAWDTNGRGRLGPHRGGDGSGSVRGEHDSPRVDEAKIKWGDEGALRTQVLKHAPGWTIIDDIYLFNGTWYVVTDSPQTIPLRRMMISTGADIWNDQPSINRREPTEKDLKIIFPSEAKRLWGHSASRIGGVTFLVNDPPQFLDHYYHFAAELLFGIWRTYASLDPSINAAGETQLLSPSRMMFPHVSAGKWNDYSKMNSFILRSIFPSMAYEYQNDWNDRIDTQRAFIFDRIVLADRAAAFRGPEFAKTWRTASEAVTLGASRYWWAPMRRNMLEFVGASGSAGVNEIDLEEFGVGIDELADEMGLSALEEHEPIKDAKPLRGGKKNTVRRRLRDEGVYHAPEVKVGRRGTAAAKAERKDVSKRGAKDDAKRADHAPSNPVITYVSRQDWGRRMLRKADHEVLVKELQALEKKYGWEVHIVAMDKLSRDDQIRLAARTTILMGVHGNGLTHLIWMNNLNPRATVMEFFYPQGFAQDYVFVSQALGMRYYGWWGKEYFAHPLLPPVAYPDGFQGNDIPLDGKAVAQLCEQRLLVDKPTEDK